MEPECGFPESNLAKLRKLCSEQTCLAAVYAFGPRESGDCDLAALFREDPSWADKLGAAGREKARDSFTVEACARGVAEILYEVRERSSVKGQSSQPKRE